MSKELEWNWSGRFTVSDVANHMLRVHLKDEHAHYAIIPITIMMQVWLWEGPVFVQRCIVAMNTLHAGIFNAVLDWSTKCSAIAVFDSQLLYQPYCLFATKRVRRMSQR